MNAPYIFVTRGDLARLRADVIIIPTSTAVGWKGATVKAIEEAWSWRPEPHELEGLRRELQKAGDATGLVLEGDAGPMSARPSAVVFVATIKGMLDPEAIRRGAENAIQVAHGLRVSPGRGPDPSRLLVAMGSLGSGKAKGTELDTLTRKQVEGVEAVLADCPGVDVALVAWDEDTRERFVAARKLTVASYDDAAVVRAIRREACVLFVGAGISKGVGLPDWKELIETMKGELSEVADAKDLETASSEMVAQLYTDLIPEGHQRLLAKTFGGEVRVPPTLAHYLLLQLPFRYVVTTNYDALVETTLESLSRPFFVVVRDSDVASSGERRCTTVFKIHGSIEEDEAVEIVLTQKEYASFSRDHEAKAALLQGLLLNHHFLFVGYGHGDPNLNTIRESVGGMLEGAERGSWATSLGGKGPEMAGLELLQADSPRNLWIRLDRIAAVCAPSARRWLADRHADGKTDLERKVRELAQLFPAEVDRLCAAGADASDVEVRAAVEVLRLLTSVGWRPEKGTRHGLWYRLAHLGQLDRITRLDVLFDALADAGGDEAKRTKAAILELEAQLHEGQAE